MAQVIGSPFLVVERAIAEVLEGIGPYTAAVNEPPWSTVAATVRPPVRTLVASNMEDAHLDALARSEREVASEVVVGIGGGTALDTAKYLAWQTGKRLVQIPTITSVDAGFTDAIGVRIDGNVRYIGRVVPELVVLDLGLIRSAPKHLNRAGIGDVLSCHTGLWDWRVASEAGFGHPWRDDLAALGALLLCELEAASEDVAAVSDDGVRFLADAYRRIGAACAEAGHSRFEEGSEHFWAYAYEHATGAHLIHGELITLGVATMSFLQGNDPHWVRDLAARCGTRAHPLDLGVNSGDLVSAILTMRAYGHANDLDRSFVDFQAIDRLAAEAAWDFACSLPR